MKSAGKRQSEINEETYKTNVTDQDEPKKDCRKSTNPNAQNLLTEINYARTELIEDANEHNIYKRPPNKESQLSEN